MAALPQDALGTSATSALPEQDRPSTATEDEDCAAAGHRDKRFRGDSVADTTASDVRVRARDGEDVVLTRRTARLLGTLKDLIDHTTSDDDIYPMPKIKASMLQMVCKLNDPDDADVVFKVGDRVVVWFGEQGWCAGMVDAVPQHPTCRQYAVSLDDGDHLNDVRPLEMLLEGTMAELSLLQLIKLIEDALYLDAPMALLRTQRVIAAKLSGKCAPELCALLGAGCDFCSAEERVAALAEPAFVPEGFETPQHPASSTAPLPMPPSLSEDATEDAKEAALGLVDVATLVELKGVNPVWRALVRRVLCSRLCRRDGQPVPTQLDQIHDLDVEKLDNANRGWDVAIAGRMLPGLARLHGYGFEVDVAAVRAADLDDDDTGSFSAKLTAVDSCILGEGEPPCSLSIAAIACAGSGIICGCPMQQMREDSVKELDLSGKDIAVDGVAELIAMCIDYLVPAMGSLTKFSLARNVLNEEDTKAICKALECGSRARLKTLKELDLSGDNYQGSARSNIGGSSGAKHVAKMLSVIESLTKLSLAENELGEEGTKSICEALEQNKTLKELDISGRHGNSNIGGSAGVKHVVKMLGVNGGLTKIE